MRIWVFALTAFFATGGARADSIEDKAVICSACHGEKGVPTDASIPIIWGQAEGYIYLELKDMKKGARKNEQMAEIVKDMSREDMLALAAYFAAKPWPQIPQPRAPKADYVHFESMATSAGCTGCHQEGYKGAGTQPRVSNQSTAYLEKTMLDFRSGARANNTWMTDLLKTYSPEDIAQMARVLGGM